GLTNPMAGAVGVDLGATFATDSELTDAISASEALDLDMDPANELSDLQITGTLLRPAEHTSELQSREHLVCRLPHEKQTDALSASVVLYLHLRPPSAPLVPYTTLFRSGLTNPMAGAVGVDLGATFATDSELTDAISASEALDLDMDPANELSDLQITGTLL